MRLDVALVKNNLSESRQEAQELIQAGVVMVDGVIVTKQTREVNEVSNLVVTRRRTFVSRGGEKLEGALLHVLGTEEVIRATLLGKNALDIGSSTGGFTDCLLKYGVASVTAIDVGTAQLHPRLRVNPYVTILENTDIRDYTSSTPFDVIVLDLSFISLEKILDKVISFGASSSAYYILLKPQFEVGKGNTKKGIVKDETLVVDLLKKYMTILETKDIVVSPSFFPCVIQGGDGNQEYFLHFTLK